MADRDETLMNFQACTGLENISECISVLERHNWSLTDAINSVSNLFEEQTVSDPNAAELSSVDDVTTAYHNHDFNAPGDPPQPQFRDLPMFNTGTLFHSAFSGPSTSNSRHDNKPARLIHFKIEYRDKNISLVIPDSDNVYRIKQLLEDEINIPPESIQLRGWPQKTSAENKTLLRDLSLPSEHTLYVLTPTITPPGGDTSNGDQNDMFERLSQNFTLNVFYKDQNRHYSLNFPGSKTIQEVKGDVYSLIDVPMSKQIWTGWPENADDDTMTLAGSGIGYPCHNLEVSKARPLNRRNQQTEVEYDVSDDDDGGFMLGDDMDLSQDDDLPTSNRLQPLISEDITDETEAVECFSARFGERYGECHPVFYRGSLEDAIKDALLVKARERKLLAIYLHHDKSILGNIFCSQLLCTDTVVHFLSNNFIVWPWDVTSDVHKNKLLELCTRHFGTVGANTVRNFKVNQLPLLIVITRTRSANEVFTAVPGSVTLDELMTNLINAVDVFQEQLKIEIKEEEERDAREEVKLQQDLAYQESLAADKKKAEAKRLEDEARLLREMEEERRRVEEQEVIEQENQMKEARRLSIRDTLPDEPSADCTEPVTHIRIRCPDGRMFNRRFLTSRPLRIVLNYVVSHGYHLEDYKVLTTFPKRDLTSMDDGQNLESLNFHAQETLIVEAR